MSVEFSSGLLAAVALFGAPGDFELQPRELAWEALSPAIFDRSWCLPEERVEQGRDLLAEMERLAALQVDVVIQGRRVRNFGDMVAATQGLGGEQRDAWLAALAVEAPRVWRDWGQGLSELLLDDHLTGDDWDPSECHPRDGILFAEPWRLKAERSGPWRNVDVSTRAHQAATIVRASLPTLKAVENDYRGYRGQVGANYEAIYPLEDSYYRGVDPAGRGFSTLRLYFRSDLPFPYTDFECDLRILTRPDGRGRLVTDIYSDSDDFHWLAGRDVFMPLETSEGAIVAYFQVRQYGFDIDGVPDGESHRKEALRASLGNLKRGAEQRYREAPTEPETRAMPPPFRVFGRR